MAGLKSLLGDGMLRGAAEDLDLRPQYDQERLEAIMNGQNFPDYRTWLQLKKQPQVVSNLGL
jgi:hypothetical protein